MGEEAGAAPSLIRLGMLGKQGQRGQCLLMLLAEKVWHLGKMGAVWAG